MNPLKPTLFRTALVSCRRWASTLPKSPMLTDPKFRYKQNWLSDPSTYPLMVIMGCAMTFMIGMGINGMTQYKDVRVDKKKRATMMRNWGEEEQAGVIQTLVRGRYEKIKSDRAARRTPVAHEEHH